MNTETKGQLRMDDVIEEWLGTAAECIVCGKPMRAGWDVVKLLPASNPDPQAPYLREGTVCETCRAPIDVAEFN
jgi:hypothetical protein